MLTSPLSMDASTQWNILIWLHGLLVWLPKFTELSHTYSYQKSNGEKCSVGENSMRKHGAAPLPVWRASSKYYRRHGPESLLQLLSPAIQTVVHLYLQLSSKYTARKFFLFLKHVSSIASMWIIFPRCVLCQLPSFFLST